MAEVTTETAPSFDTTPEAIRAMLDSAEAAAPPAGEAAPVAEAAPVPEKVEAAPAAETDSPESRRERIEERALARIVERERKVAERERALSEQKDTKGEQPWTKARIRSNTSEYLKTLGLDPGTVARALMVDALGDKAPEEYRRIASQLKDGGARDEEVETLGGRLRDLEAKYEATLSAQRAEQYRADYGRQLNGYVSGDVSKYPHAARAFKEDPSWATAAAMSIVAADADHKIRTNVQDAAPLSPEDAIAALNTELAHMARRIGATVTAPAAPERKTLLNPTPVPAPPAGSDVDALSKEAMDWLLKQ